MVLSMNEVGFTEVHSKFIELGILRLNLIAEVNKTLNEVKYTDKIFFEVRDSFINKLLAIKYHHDLFGVRINEYKQMATSGKFNVLNEVSERGIHPRFYLMSTARSETTFLIEDIIYHSLSCIENLSFLICFCYKDGSGGGMNSRFNSITKNQHNSKTQLSNFLDKEFQKTGWLRKLYDNRAEIYHTMSIMNPVSYIERTEIQSNVIQTDSLSIKLPKKLIQVFYAEKINPDPTEFCDLLRSSVYLFCYSFMNCIIEDYKLNKDRMKITY